MREQGAAEVGAPPAAPAPAPVLLTDALRTELVADAREVFSADVLETPQDIRDVIEYVDSWLQVYIQKRAESGAPAPAPQPLSGADPCPGCRPGTVCRTPKCGRLRAGGITGGATGGKP